jgi:hypothetical protein
MTVLDYYPPDVHFRVGDETLRLGQLEELLSQGQEARIPVQPDPAELNPLRGACPRYTSFLIDKMPTAVRPPGLVIKYKEQLQILVRIDRLAESDVESWRAKVIRQLHKFGCKAEGVDTFPLAAQVQSALKGKTDPWIRRVEFKTWDDLLKIDTREDEDALINPSRRFLCRGGSFLIVAPSGVGKSTLLMQMAVCWAIGESFFGIRVKRPLKCVLLQAENDDGDIAEMAQGVAAGLELKEKKKRLLMQNLVIVSKFSTPDNVLPIPETRGRLSDVIRN